MHPETNVEGLRPIWGGVGVGEVGGGVAVYGTRASGQETALDGLNYQ